MQTNFPEAVRTLCARAGSVEKFAQQLGKPRATIERWKNGESRPSDEIIDRIAELYGSQIEFIYQPQPKTE